MAPVFALEGNVFTFLNESQASREHVTEVGMLGSMRRCTLHHRHLVSVRTASACIARRCHNKTAPSSLTQGASQWELKPSSSAPVLLETESIVLQLQRHTHGVSQTVLPRGFPDSVASGYAGYSGWLAVGLFAHSFTVMVSTNALLSGFFAEMSAASWLMKDLLPPLVAGSLAGRIRTLEANPKRWFGAACFGNSLLGCTEFLIPHLLPKETWMALAIMTNIGKMSGYLIIGASRAVLQKTLATGDNLGEVTAKLGTLGMLMHCFGSATALTLTSYVGFYGQLGAISLGAVAGFYAPMRASQCVVMSSVNTVSLRRLVERWAAAREGSLPSASVTSPADAPSSTTWECPTPQALHDELAARWTIRHSLLARASIWRELLLTDANLVVKAGGGAADGDVALRVAPALTASDVAALAGWREALRDADVEVPSAYSLGAGGDGRLLLLYSTTASAADVIEGFAVAWLAARASATALNGESDGATAGLAAACVASLPAWRRDTVTLRDAMELAGWQCAVCSVDDVSRRIEWRD